MAHPAEFDVHQVLRDGTLVAVLMGIDHGDSFTVVTEVFTDGESEGVQRRPYTFHDADSAHAFIGEAVTTFTYLGCEIRTL